MYESTWLSLIETVAQWRPEIAARRMTLLRYERAVMPAPVGFPWKSLTVLRADEVSIERDARHAIAELVDFALLRDVLSTLFVASLDHVAVSSTNVTSERRDLGSRFTLTGGGLSVWLSVDPALVVMLLKRVLGQREGLIRGRHCRKR